MMHPIFRCARALVFAGIAFCAFAHAAPDVSEAQTVPLSDAPIVPGEYNGDVRNLPPVSRPRPLKMLNEFPHPANHKPLPTPAAPNPPPPVLNAPMPSPIVNFAGLSFNSVVTGGQAGAGFPPDINGDVGPTYYIEAVNDAWGIFNKSTGALVSAFTENQLWSGAGTGTQCDANNFGDPVVLHDGLADRWILTNFAFTIDASNNPVGPFYQCFAVSKSSDPVAGGWWLYAVRMDTGAAGAPPVNTFADYGKFGLMTDCLYMGANGFNNSSGVYAGAIFAAFNRTAMFNGTALSSTNSSLGFINDTTLFGNFPANLNGTSAGSLPPSGTEYFVAESGTAFSFDVRKFQAGATACGTGATLGAATNVAQASYGLPYIKVGGQYTTDMVSQPGAGKPKLDSLGDEIMQRVVYRKIGSTESLWVVHTTCGTGADAAGACATSTTVTQPQWAQINVSGGTVNATPVQQQIYNLGDGRYRWMGSLAVDGQGNMAVGYSRSNATAPNYPSIAYAGRLVGDTLNQLPQTEVVLQAGAGVQNTYSRWGDYTAMTIDPSDDCTFWYTNEYYAATGTNWNTRIGAFKFPNCVGNVPTKLVFTQQPNASYASAGTITVKVSVENALNAVMTSDTSAITLALQGGTAGATLSGTKTVNAVAGVATFTLSLDKAGTGYSLHASDGNLTVADSSAFNITAGAAQTVTFTTQPASNSNIAAGVAIPLVAHVADAAGNAVSGQSITLGFGNNPGSSTLSVGPNPVTNASGDATFNSLSLNKSGVGYTLRATDGTTPSATAALSNAFNIVAAAPLSIVFTTQPASGSNITAGATIALAAQVKDGFGNAIAGDNVTLAFASNPGGATLMVSTNPVATNSSGIATFNNVSLGKAGSGYALKATEANALRNITSNAFNIVAGIPVQLVFTTQPTNVTPGSTLNTIAVSEEDALGNIVTSDSSSNVDFSVSACGGVALGSAIMSNGVATLSAAQVFNALRAGLAISANDAALSINGVSQTFNVDDVSPSDLLFGDGYETCAL